MQLGRVLGSAVCTIKVPHLDGVKLLTVHILNKKLEPVGKVQVAADAVQAGVGDLVVLVRAREASLALHGEKFVPIDLACVGIVNELDIRQLPDSDFEYRSGFERYS